MYPNIVSYFSSLIFVIGLAHGEPASDDKHLESDFSRRLEPVGRILEEEGWNVWCVAPIYGDDGKVHVFYSRWKGSFNNWVSRSEVAHAVADSPEGPYKTVGVALSGRGGDAFDSWAIHNPTIHKVGDRYVMFYMGTDGSKLGIEPEDVYDMTWEEYKPFFKRLVANKTIGVAVSDSLYGPWERPDEPVLKPGPPATWDDLLTTNPSFLPMADGTYRLYYKSMDKDGWEKYSGNRKYGVATADNLLGPYKKLESNPILSFAEGQKADQFGGHKPAGKNSQLEDAYVWHEDGLFKMIMRDMGFINHEYGLYFESKDGLCWTSAPQIAFREAGHYFDEKLIGLEREGRFERPQLLMKDGRPDYLFCSWRGGKYKTASGVVLRVSQKNEATGQEK
jgi:hypothetical protein